MKGITRLFTALTFIGALGVWGAPTHASTETVLYTFSGGVDGSKPFGTLIQDKKGNLYGTTLEGGSNGYGTVYRLEPPYGQSNESVLFSFSGADGAYPYGGLIMDKAGNLYGTTSEGGTAGHGVVFKLSPPYGQSSETVLYNFSGGADGGFPQPALHMDKKGNLFGTTNMGGSGLNAGEGGYGVVFELAPPYGQSNEKVLYSFSGGSDGAHPQVGALIEDKEGNLYGTTVCGGNATGYSGDGVVYKLNAPYGQDNEKVLYTFTGGNDGKTPYFGLNVDKKGNLYGMAQYGGAYGYGVVFEISPPYDSETVLYAFPASGDGGAYPYGGLIIDKKGNLYGNAQVGGNGGWGTAFALSAPYGQTSQTVLYNFSGGADGGAPQAVLLRDKKGNLYGVTQGGGSTTGWKGAGVVFKISP